MSYDDLEKEKTRLLNEIDMTTWVNDHVNDSDRLILAKLMFEDLIAALNRQLYRINIMIIEERKNRILKIKEN